MAVQEVLVLCLCNACQLLFNAFFVSSCLHGFGVGVWEEVVDMEGVKTYAMYVNK